MNNWQLIETAGFPAGLAFYAGHAFLPWWTTCAMTSLAMLALAQFKPPPYILMAIGSIAAAFITLPYTNWLTGVWDSYWPTEELKHQIAPLFSPEFWRYTTSATVIWFIVNFIFDRFLGLPRYRYKIPRGYDFHDPWPKNAEDAEPEAAVSTSERPGFLKRVPARLEISEVLALKAEQHYIRVYTKEREYMVLYRFSDAVRELDSGVGTQVHRSFWVSTQAIDLVKPRAKKFSIKLSTGDEIPVSAPYHAIVKELARAQRLATRH